jgi:hypothetical protein
VPNTLSQIGQLEVSKDLPVKWAEQDRFIEALARRSQQSKDQSDSQPLAQKTPSRDAAPKPSEFRRQKGLC